MRFRWNSFTVIGLLLILIGIYGLARGAAFQFDAGLPSEPHEGWIYIGVGVLMLINGIVTPRAIPAPDDVSASDAESAASAASAPSSTGADARAK